MKSYIRFGKIPIDEKSKVFYNGEYIIKEEMGVSVFDLEYIDSRPRIVLPIIVTSSILNCIEGYVSDYINGSWKEPVYEVTGDLIGYGSDNEPLIKNVKIIRELQSDELFDISHCFKMEEIDYTEIPRAEVYYVKINNLNWYKASKSFYDKFDGKKIISKEALANPDEKVEELYNKVIKNGNTSWI